MILAEEEHRLHPSGETDSEKGHDDHSITRKLLEDAISISVFDQTRGPSWRQLIWNKWHLTKSFNTTLAQCKLCAEQGYHSGSKESCSNFFMSLQIKS